MRAIALLCLVLTACGSDDDSDGNPGLASCTVSTEAFDGTTLKLCTETSGSGVSQLQQACRSQTASFPEGGPALTQRAEFVAGPCSHVNALGGCRTTQQGTSATIWYYAVGAADSGTGQTSDDIRQLCQGVGAEFVPP